MVGNEGTELRLKVGTVIKGNWGGRACWGLRLRVGTVITEIWGGRASWKLQARVGTGTGNCGVVGLSEERTYTGDAVLHL